MINVITSLLLMKFTSHLSIIEGLCLSKEGHTVLNSVPDFSIITKQKNEVITFIKLCR